MLTFCFSRLVMLRILLLITCFAFLTPLAAAESRISGRVVNVADGDTLTLLDANRQRVKVRLAEIDSPEQAQPYGNRAKHELKTLVYQKAVDVIVVDIDQYGRVVGRVMVAGIDINAEMVRRGAAWVYRRHLKRPELIRIEQVARQASAGLWALPAAERIPPWQWRYQQKQLRSNGE
jgi:micrococcal nuclease